MDNLNTPNLDASSPDELAVYQFTFHNIAVYALNKRAAVLARLSGDIHMAQTHETTCDDIYDLLPEWARW